MTGFHRLFRRDSDPDDVIPPDSPWYWRWGIPGLKAVMRYRELTSGKFDHLRDSEIARLARVTESYESAQFACLYGREGGRRLREYVRYIEEYGCVSRDELRKIIRAGDLSVRKSDSVIVIRPPWRAAACGVALLITNILAVIMLSHLIYSATAAAEGKVLAFMFVAVLCGYNIWEFNITALKPYRISQRRSPVLNSTLKIFVSRSGPKLVRR
jgi:hypothetical protein